MELKNTTAILHRLDSRRINGWSQVVERRKGLSKLQSLEHEEKEMYWKLQSLEHKVEEEVASAHNSK